MSMACISPVRTQDDVARPLSACGHRPSRSLFSLRQPAPDQRRRRCSVTALPPSPNGRRPSRSLFCFRNSRCGSAATSASSPRAETKGEHGPGEGQRNATDHEDAQHVGGVDLLPVHYGPHLSHTHIHTYAHTYKKVETLARTREGGHTTRRCQPAPGTPTPGPVLSLASPLALPLQATRPPTANESLQFLQSPAPTPEREPLGPPARASGFRTSVGTFGFLLVLEAKTLRLRGLGTGRESQAPAPPARAGAPPIRRHMPRSCLHVHACLCQRVRLGT